LQEAGTSIAFEPKTPNVEAAAQHVINGNLSHILGLLQKDAFDLEEKACSF
jgi:hypothetical protein